MMMKYGEALQKALYDSLKKDNRTVFFGEDDRCNLYGYTDGLLSEFGPERVRDIPLSEAGAVGVACGAAICGMHPIVDLTTENFLYVAMDQICSIAAKTSYMYGGSYSVPITIFCSDMSHGGNAAQHSDRLHSLFMSVPGLKIICPASPQDMYSLFIEAVRDPNPVLCFTDRSLFWIEEEVDVNCVVPIGNAKLVSEGDDITIVFVSGCYKYIKELLQEEKDNISMDVIDVRSVVPLDMNTILKSLSKTGRIVICDTAARTGSLAGHIASLVVEKGFELLHAPVGIVTGCDVPVPYARSLEQEVLVTKQEILETIKRISSY